MFRIIDKPYSDPHEIPEIPDWTPRKERDSKMWRYFQRKQWARPIRRLRSPLGPARWFLNIQAAGEDLARELGKPAGTLVGNIRTGAESRRLNGYGVRYGYKWEWCTEGEALSNGADCI